MLSASGLLTFSQLLLQIINKVLRTLLCEEFARFMGHVRFLAEGFELVPFQRLVVQASHTATKARATDKARRVMSRRFPSISNGFN